MHATSGKVIKIVGGEGASASACRVWTIVMSVHAYTRSGKRSTSPWGRKHRSSRVVSRCSCDLGLCSLRDDAGAGSPTVCAHAYFSSLKIYVSKANRICLSEKNGLVFFSPRPKLRRTIMANTKVVNSRAMEITAGNPNQYIHGNERESCLQKVVSDFHISRNCCCRVGSLESFL